MTEIYLDPKQPVEACIKDLMSKLTVDEKVEQLVQLPGWTNPQPGQVPFMHGACPQAIKDQRVHSFGLLVKMQESQLKNKERHV
ncbi:hypothetical protein M9Y10_027743 [Tritrichomonas musculus]|uniref:Uncharacterized protein n=1 Tax=Tritrichomonas musculus TaxID=1915356 RepID=A0ABR2H419_9EUKA